MIKTSSYTCERYECEICTVAKSLFLDFPCGHKCCKMCYMKIDKCHMCRAALPQIFKIELKICNITVPFYFCRGDADVDGVLQVRRNTYIIHNILAAHNLAGFMDDIKSKDITIDMNKIRLDALLSYKLATFCWNGKSVDDLDNVLFEFKNVDSIVNSYYFPEHARPFIKQPTDEEMEIESKILFENVIMLIRMTIATHAGGEPVIRLGERSDRAYDALCEWSKYDCALRTALESTK
jgi:hypothetical protein